jgi:DNA-binding HxlR family transcriptional regulator
MSCENSICPISKVLELISAKWTVEILREVALKPVRTREFLRVIPGLSMKSLQERLKALLAAGMIERIVFQEKLPRVEHTITPRGQRLFRYDERVQRISGRNRLCGYRVQVPIGRFQ